MLLKVFCLFSGGYLGLLGGIYLRETGLTASIKNSYDGFTGKETDRRYRPFQKASDDIAFDYHNETLRGLKAEELFKEQAAKMKQNRSGSDNRNYKI